MEIKNRKTKKCNILKWVAHFFISNFEEKMPQKIVLAFFQSEVYLCAVLFQSTQALQNNFFNEKTFVLNPGNGKPLKAAARL